MFVYIGIILVIAWVLGFVVFHVAGALIHILLLLAAVSTIVNSVRGRSTV